MLTEAQVQYVEEVLGVSASYFARGTLPVSAVVVVTPHLSAEELTLLKKILLSAKLTHYQHHEADAKPPMTAKHVLFFMPANAEVGRVENAGQIHWHLPALGEMTGSAGSVSDTKKRTWNLLQQFMKEAAL